MDKLALLERENAELRERVAYLEDMLIQPDERFRLFGLTTSEQRVFSALMAHQQVSRDRLMWVAYGDRSTADDVPEQKMVDVFVCKIRKKLKPFGLSIQTIWGHGYTIDPPTKLALRELIDAAFGHEAEAPPSTQPATTKAA